MATLVLAVAIGVNLLVFTVVNALWLRPLPFHEPDRVVTVLIPALGFGTLDTPGLKIFEGGVAGQVMTNGPFEAIRPRIEIAEAGRAIETLGVTSGYFTLLGVAIRGRNFTVEDDRDGAEGVAIISDDLWARVFARRPDVIGAVLPRTPLPLRVIGVAPKDFRGVQRGERADLWIPASLVRRSVPGASANTAVPIMVFGRLGPEQTVAATEQRYHELMDPKERAWIQKNSNLVEMPRVVPVTEIYGTPESRTAVVREGNALLVVSGLTLLVLVGGCATIATLVLTHYERRRAELAIKLSLGAGRVRLSTELARDLSWIAAMGTACGILLATVGARIVPSLSLPGGVNIGRLDLAIDWRVCAVAIAATAVTLCAAAAVPLARTTRLRLAGELLSGPSTTTLGSIHLRQALLALQVSSAIVVLVAAGLFVRAVTYGFGSATGFDVDRTVFVSIQERPPGTTPSGISTSSLIAERGARLTSVLAALPGVSEVAESFAPIGANAAGSRPVPRTVKVQGHEEQLLVGILRGSPNLLSALGVPILAGRTLTAADTAASGPEPAVITWSMAQRLWPGGGALGETFALPQLRNGSYVVVGIARDLAFGSLMRPGDGVVVTIGGGYSVATSSFVIRTDAPEVVVGATLRTVKALLVDASTGREVVARDIGRQRLGAWFFSGFGLAALLLGVGSVFGLVAYLAESRRREFGVRMALGATMSDLVRQGLLAALVPVSIGVAAGLALGALVSRLFTALLVGVPALDSLTYLTVATTMLTCAVIAALAAAWRLRRTSPADALRAI